ncbi:sulfotransferase [Sphingosinicella sp. CPCC 101087]|uniref:sulfotransferase family protein n=1 Tax=Sphingosinicella sp. CPCC 101087 TaxID=2497754 RepID=UPI0013EC2B94|nr:sulfotransferase [Sphingosinicella sp. CPCC 101087]
MMTPPGSDAFSARPRRVGSLLSKAWEKGLLPRPDLEEVSAKAAALDESFGAQPAAPWRAALERLILSLAQEARLNEIGLTFAYVQLKGLLQQRQSVWRQWKSEPAILTLPVAMPVIVLGHMRSGTTRIQRLLGCDHRLNHTRFYEVMHPAPPAGLGLRVARSWAELRLLNFLNPALRAVHPTSARAVEEVFGLLSFSFYGAQLEAQWRVPGFARQWEGESRTGVYEELKRLVATIAWTRGGTLKPWVLKAPQFMEDLDVLLDIFPDARLICLHRDPVEVVGSSASLVWNQMRVQSDAADRRWIGAEWLYKTARRSRICAAVRQSRPEVPQIDVSFDDVNRDWRGEMRRIYAFLNLDLTPQVERNMQAYLSKAARSGYRKHSYRLEDFGLNADTVRKEVGPGHPFPI